MKNKFIRILLITIMFICILQIQSFADDEENEIIEMQEVWEEVSRAGAEVSKEPSINSRAAVVFDRKTKTVIFEKNKDQKRAMASTTKIMTAIIVLENADLNKEVEVSAKAAGIGGSRLGLKKKDKITINDLLYGLMLCSRK